MESPKPGDVIDGRYRIERLVGEGGMGVVLAAHHRELGERVALKILRPELSRDPQVVERFLNEARSSLRIHSEHVARALDLGRLPSGSPYLVMEYLDGRNLDEELALRGPLPISEAVNYVLQASIGLAEAHALGIVHRDLKPANLFLVTRPDGRRMVKVLDFGIAKVLNDGESSGLTNSFMALGSAAYMSPEQIRAAKHADPRADVWSMAVTLFELITSQRPFLGDSATAIVAAIIADPPRSMSALRPEVSADLDEIVAACLEKDVERRLTSVGDLAKRLAPHAGKRGASLASRVRSALGEDDDDDNDVQRLPFVSSPDDSLTGFTPSGGYRRPEPSVPDTQAMALDPRPTGPGFTAVIAQESPVSAPIANAPLPSRATLQSDTAKARAADPRSVVGHGPLERQFGAATSAESTFGTKSSWVQTLSSRSATHRPVLIGVGVGLTVACGLLLVLLSTRQDDRLAPAQPAGLMSAATGPAASHGTEPIMIPPDELAAPEPVRDDDNTSGLPASTASSGPAAAGGPATPSGKSTDVSGKERASGAAPSVQRKMPDLGAPGGTQRLPPARVPGLSDKDIP